ncbi:MAG: galactose-1-phosphate uridylyltransferase [Campylobacterota bacterium]|nr:galactose-1-phosphate uridylyltransferase [Campylobacterota bacterium]
MSEFRYNTLKKEWVLFSPNRAKRPNEFVEDKLSTNASGCPFELGSEHLTPNELAIIGTNDNWKCRVVPNLYHALSINADLVSSKDACFEKKSGFGAHEVIIETPLHSRQMYNFSLAEFSDYITIMKIRVADLIKDKRLKYFSIFKNSGISAGATLEHSHTQLIAMPFIPPKIADDLTFFKNHKQKHDRDFFDDLIYSEKEFKKGILIENSSFIAYCPYASTYAFEVSIVAKNSVKTLLDCDDKDIYALSEVLEYVYSRLFSALGDFSFNMLIKNGEINSDENSNRFHIQILPRLYKIAGYELDSDVFINTILPEKATEILKD